MSRNKAQRATSGLDAGGGLMDLALMTGDRGGDQ